MPYVPSKKTDGKSNDREVLDAAVEQLAEDVARRLKNNFSLIEEYERVFAVVAGKLADLVAGKATPVCKSDFAEKLAERIYAMGFKYEYEGAFLGELNYAITRLIQRVPQIQVRDGAWKDELRYWVYAATVEALTYAHQHTLELKIGIGGVFEDVKDEYKRRVNTAYEAKQILRSGDCYDTPYYTRLISVVDPTGKVIGYQEVMLERSLATVNLDELDFEIVVRKKN